MSTDKKLNLLQKLLSERALSIGDIQLELDLKSRQSAYNYIDILKQNGICINSKQQGHKKLFFLENSPTDQPISIQSAKEFLVLSLIRKKEPISTQELLEQINNDRLDYSLQLGQTALYSIITELIDNGSIHYMLVGNKRILYTTDNSLFFGNYESLEHNLEHLFEQITYLSQENALVGPLNSVKKKIGILLGYLDSTINIDSDYDYSITGRNYSKANTFEYLLKKIDGIPYISKGVYLKFKDRDGNTIKTSLFVGLCVFSVESNEMYFIGKTSLSNVADIIIRIDSIIEISAMAENNPLYQSKHYNAMFEYMWSVSSETPSNVIIRFKNTQGIQERLLTINKVRKHSKLTVTDEAITYTDRIIGLSGFAHYLRQFNDNYEVMEPAELKNIIYTSAKKTLQRYGESIDA